MTSSGNSLRPLLGLIWRELVAGCAQWDHPFRTAALGTAGSGGIRLRTVILREARRNRRQLIFHTDLRSPKMVALRRTSTVEWLFYHPREKLQVRVRAVAEWHVADAVADRAWKRTPLASRLNYLTKLPPGRTIERPRDAWTEGVEPGQVTVAQSEEGRRNFAVVITEAREIEYLKLDVEGNRRALFTWEGNGWSGSWLIP